VNASDLVSGFVDESSQQPAGEAVFDQQAGAVIVDVGDAEVAAPPLGQSTLRVPRHVHTVQWTGRDRSHLRTVYPTYPII